MASHPKLAPTIAEKTLSAAELQKMDAYWRATLYLCVGMIYLRQNPLLKEPLQMEDVKKELSAERALRPVNVISSSLLKEWDNELDARWDED